MTLLQSLFLGALQGITEFLPISSSGHLVLLESILGLNVETLKGFDVVLHLGTLLAMVVYFWNDLWGLLKKPNRIGMLVLATIPAAAVGLTLEDSLDEWFRDPVRVLEMLFILGIFFLIAEKWPAKKNRTEWTLKNTLIMGLAQAVALIPGISRSGSVIATGLLQGLRREEAARFSFLLGIPAIAGAALLTGVKMFEGEALLPPFDVVAVGFVTSALVGYASVSFLMKFLKIHTLRGFSIYLFAVSVGGFLLTK